MLLEFGEVFFERVGFWGVRAWLWVVLKRGRKKAGWVMVEAAGDVITTMTYHHHQLSRVELERQKELELMQKKQKKMEERWKEERKMKMLRKKMLVDIHAGLLTIQAFIQSSIHPSITSSNHSSIQWFNHPIHSIKYSSTLLFHIPHYSYFLPSLFSPTNLFLSTLFSYHSHCYHLFFSTTILLLPPLLFHHYPLSINPSPTILLSLSTTSLLHRRRPGGCDGQPLGSTQDRFSLPSWQETR